MKCAERLVPAADLIANIMGAGADNDKDADGDTGSNDSIAAGEEPNAPAHLDVPSDIGDDVSDGAGTQRSTLFQRLLSFSRVFG